MTITASSGSFASQSPTDASSFSSAQTNQPRSFAIATNAARDALIAELEQAKAISDESRRRADAYLTGGYGGLVGFELAGGAAAGRRFIDALQLFYHVANIGDARSLQGGTLMPTDSQRSKVFL